MNDATLGDAVIRADVSSHMANAGWGADRYKDLKGLDPRSQQVIADLKGPGVIRELHLTHMRAQEDVVLEIWFDDATEPAVMVPLTQFFCNAPISTRWIENGPGSWNAYFAMPFQRHAKVVLRNDGAQHIDFYSFVEWEKLPRWSDELGYFHAASIRKVFQLTAQSDEEFFKVVGSGHLIGRYWTITTNEPAFNQWLNLMEGNNEVNLDGKVREIDYLGSEDSFNFSWGWQGTWLGRRSGITENRQGKLCIYRFHDHMPIRFNRELIWKVNWEYENFPPTLSSEAAQRTNGQWVNYNMVYYWYLKSPGGYHHALLPLPDRNIELIIPKKS